MASPHLQQTSYLSELNTTPDLEALVRPHLLHLRDGFHHAIKERPDEKDWLALGMALDAKLDHLRLNKVHPGRDGTIGYNLRVLTSRQICALDTFVSKAFKTDKRLKQVQRITETIYESYPAWEAAFGPARASYWEHALVTWLFALEGAKSRQPAKVVAGFVTDIASDLEPTANDNARSRRTTQPEASNINLRRRSWRRHLLAVFMVTGVWWRTVNIGATLKSIAQRLKKTWARSREKSVPRPAPTQTALPKTAARAEPPQTIASKTSAAPTVVQNAKPLNGKALQTSAFGTWLGLVVLSWVSLLWGALIALPFGLGLGIIAMLGVGIIAVPLWGTVFGLLGMQGARGSTLRSMKFAELPEDDAFFKANADFAKQLDIPAPKIGTVEVYNAFAMGAHRNNATVALGKSLLKDLTEDEARAVLGHELGHVVSGDMRRMMLMRTFQNACVWYMGAQELKQFARWVISWVAELFILAFSRKREFWADAIGAALTSKNAMIGALQKLEAGPKLTEHENINARFMCRGRAKALLSTHPTTDDRIAALEAETYLKKLPFK